MMQHTVENTQTQVAPLQRKSPLSRLRMPETLTPFGMAAGLPRPSASLGLPLSLVQRLVSGVRAN